MFDHSLAAVLAEVRLINQMRPSLVCRHYAKTITLCSAEVHENSVVARFRAAQRNSFVPRRPIIRAIYGQCSNTYVLPYLSIVVLLNNGSEPIYVWSLLTDDDAV